MRKIIIGIFLATFFNISYSNEVISGFKMPESVAEGLDGSIYLSEIGERDKDKDGKLFSTIEKDLSF